MKMKPLLLAGALLALSFSALADTTIVTRAGKDSALTANEVDANFTNLKATADGAATAVAGKAPATSGTSILLGSGSGGFTSYSGTSCTNQFVRSVSAVGAATCATVANADLANSAITIAGTSTALGASITLDTITGLSSTGLVKRTGSNALGIASGGTDYEVPLTFAARLDRTSNTIDLGNSGVTAGSCTSCDLTIDAYGRVTVKASGSGGGSTPSGTGFVHVTSGTQDGAAVGETGTGNVVRAASPTITGHATIEGVTATGATGTGKIVFDGSPAFTTPDLGTPSALVATNASGTAASLTAGHVTTNANLTGDITSSGNATTLATVNSNVGSFTNANVTVNAKGLVTAASSGSGSGGMVKIAKVVTTSSASTITFSSIPGTYTDLKIIISGRDTATGSGDIGIKIKVNSDGTSGNYTSAQYLLGSITTVAAGTSAASSAGMQIANIPGTSGLAGAMGMADITIPNYAGTAFHKIMSSQGADYFTGTPTLQVIHYMGVWKSTAAITDLVLTAGGTAFVDGTTATLYGMGG